MSKLNKLIHTPYGVMILVVIMYVLKTVSMLYTGIVYRVVPLRANGWHSGGDIVEALAVIFAVFLKNMPPSAKYPFGKGNAVSVMKILSAFGLSGVIIKLTELVLEKVRIAYDVIVTGSQVTVQDQMILSVSSAIAVTAVLGLSAVASFTVGRLQINVGKKNEQEALEVDGKETLSDGWIEVILLIGILSQYLTLVLTSSFWQIVFICLEIILVAYVVKKLAGLVVEFATEGVNSILHRSLDEDVVSEIFTTASNIRGVDTIETLITFKEGNVPVAIIQVYSFHKGKAQRHIEYGLDSRISKVLLGEGCGRSTCKVFITVSLPHDKKWHREAYLVSEDGVTLAKGVEDCGFIGIADVSYGKVDRCTIEPVNGYGEIVKYVIKKRAISVHLYGCSDTLQDLLVGSGIEVVYDPTRSVPHRSIGV